MRRSALLALIGGVLLVLSCSEITTRTESATFVVVLDASSPILNSQADTLVFDDVQFSVTVFEIQGADSQSTQVSAPIFASSNPNVVQIDAGTGAATFPQTGTSTVTVTFSENVFPDSLLRGALVVPVDSFSVEITPRSETADSTGELLESDIVMFQATVKRKDGRTVPTVGQQFVSEDPTVIAFIDDTLGIASLQATGQTPVAVSFEEPRVPAGTLTGVDTFTVVDFALTLSVASVAGSTAIASGDTLVSDSVQFSATLIKDGTAQTIVDPTWTSSDPAVVEIVDASTGRAYFAGVGAATVTFSFTNPVVPQQSDSMEIDVATFAVQISGPVAPVMGDTVFYTATVTDTRTGQDTAAAGQIFASTDPSIVQVLNSATGMTLARDLGGATVTVTFTDPSLPNAPVSGSLPIGITDERFYGTFSAASGDFGDPIFVDSSGVHSFTDSTRVLFANGTVGFVTSSTPELLRFTVGAGSETSQLILTNLMDESGGLRDSVLTKITFEGGGTVDDPFEPNDTFPLTGADEITSFPFEALLSWDPSKSAPADTNFFWFTVTAAQAPITLDVTATWQQDADLDFVVCNGNAAPPTDYGFGCPRPDTDNSVERDREEAIGLGPLNVGSFVIAFYCVDCPAVPLTYSVQIAEQ